VPLPGHGSAPSPCSPGLQPGELYKTNPVPRQWHLSNSLVGKLERCHYRGTELVAQVPGLKPGATGRRGTAVPVGTSPGTTFAVPFF